jgi:thioredoxin 1
MAATANVLEVDDASFDEQVIAAEIPVLVEFGAPWCPPCKALAPIVERLAVEMAGRVRVVSVDTDASPLVAAKYGIRGVPTVIVFRNGEKTAQHVGATTREKLVALLGVGVGALSARLA